MELNKLREKRKWEAKRIKLLVDTIKDIRKEGFTMEEIGFQLGINRQMAHYLLRGNIIHSTAEKYLKILKIK